MRKPRIWDSVAEESPREPEDMGAEQTMAILRWRGVEVAGPRGS
jgi:hypothetical protein